MNTREFVRSYKKLRKHTGDNFLITDEEAREEIEALFALIGDVLAMDEVLKFKNKGNFVLKKGRPRKIGNLHTGEVEEIKVKNSVKFIQSKLLNLDNEE